MKLLISALLIVVLEGSSLPTPQQNNDPAFKAFWTRFRTAVVKNDKEAVASMTRLPFLFESRERSRAEFVRIQNQLFTRKIRRCFAAAKPQREGEMYDVFCGALIFYFGRVDGEFKFLEFGVND